MAPHDHSNPDPNVPAADAWYTPALRDDLEALYAELDAAVAATGVVCWIRSRCCDFEVADHVLFASSIEIAHVRAEHPERFEDDSVLCPFWKERLCTLRERRPLGCRAYFCDPVHRDRLEELHEEHLRRLKDLADRHGVPWRYVPFVATLRSDS